MPPFVSRELSWIKFNERVLAEAQRAPDSLPLERLKFLAITASNLDEFFMVRISYLNDRKTLDRVDDAGLTAGEQLELVMDRTRAFIKNQTDCLTEILDDLKEKGIFFLKSNELSEKHRNWVKNYFDDEILPVITPLAIDPARPFPFLANKSLNICVRMRDDEGKTLYTVIQVPSILPRFVSLPPDNNDENSEKNRYFLPLEELIIDHLTDICNIYEIKAYGCFRITRSADLEADEDTENLLEEMKRTVKKRKRGRPIRLELSENFDDKMKEFLREALPVSKRYMIEMSGFLDLTALMKIYSIKGFDNLRVKSFVPKTALDFKNSDSMFDAIRERDRMIHHPYESFDHVVEFIREAAEDPNVLAIKQTLYRVSGKSKIIAALEQAAEAGKQVTVLVELKARFDEENNIQWATQLERAGCHVIYGLTGLKTHCKITLAVRRDEDGIRRYLHLSTGNYNDATARLYTDICMFTCRPAFGADASALFNHLTGFSSPPQYNKFAVAPDNLKTFFLDRIEHEIKNAKSGYPCGINIKINSLLDSDIIKKLYEASNAGVPIKLLVRGICSLIPGISGVSENIKVRSIVGRFLEHSRVFVFENAGDPLMYMGSADLMPRNLERRVEVVFPIEEPLIKARIDKALGLMWRDSTNAWEMGADSEYRRVKKRGNVINSQLLLLQK